VAALQFSCVGCAVPSVIVGYEILGGSVFSKYGTFALEVKISWNSGNGADLRVIHNNIFYVSFSNDIFFRFGNNY
jgi:hypothetical protein